MATPTNTNINVMAEVPKHVQTRLKVVPSKPFFMAKASQNTVGPAKRFTIGRHCLSYFTGQPNAFSMKQMEKVDRCIASIQHCLIERSLPIHQREMKWAHSSSGDGISKGHTMNHQMTQPPDDQHLV